MVFDKRRIYFFDRNVIYYEAGAGISSGGNDETLVNKIKKIHEEMNSDVFKVDELLLERCKKFPSDFSTRLTQAIYDKREAQRKWAELQEKLAKIEEQRQKRQNIKKKLGIFALPIVLTLRVLRKLKSFFQEKPKPQEKPNPVELIKTDINVSTDFANLCMNRE